MSRPANQEHSAVRNAARAASRARGTKSGRASEQLTAAAANPPVHGPTTYVQPGKGYDLVPFSCSLVPLLVNVKAPTPRVAYTMKRAISYTLKPKNRKTGAPSVSPN